MDKIRFNTKVLGQGVPFIWGHGLMGSMAVEDATGWFGWESFPAEIQLLRYDARGHGGSESTYRPEDYHWNQLAKDMFRFADEAGVDDFVAGGQSMGCATSIYAAYLNPKRIKGLVLMNPPTAWETRDEQASLYKKMAFAAKLLGGKTLSKMIRKNPGRLLPQWLVDVNIEKVSAYADAIAPMSRKSLENILKGAMISNLPEREKLKGLKMPTLILAWHGDPTHPIESVDTLKELIPQCEIDVVRDFDRFSRWPRLIQEFVGKLS